MAKKKMKLEWWHIAIVVVAIIAILYFMLPGEGDDGAAGAPDCTPDSGDTIGTCCYDINKNPIVCPTTTPVTTQAIYQGTPGIYYIQHVFRADNTGNVALDAYILDVSCELGGVPDTTCETSYANIVGIVYEKPIALAGNAMWTGDLIPLQDLPTGTYTVGVEICAQDQAAQLTEVCKQASTSFTTEPEGIDFTTTINIG